jgi:hypothetical protein
LFVFFGVFFFGRRARAPLRRPPACALAARPAPFQETKTRRLRGVSLLAPAPPPRQDRRREGREPLAPLLCWRALRGPRQTKSPRTPAAPPSGPKRLSTLTPFSPLGTAPPRAHAAENAAPCSFIAGPRPLAAEATKPEAPRRLSSPLRRSAPAEAPAGAQEACQRSLAGTRSRCCLSRARICAALPFCPSLRARLRDRVALFNPTGRRGDSERPSRAARPPARRSRCFFMIAWRSTLAPPRTPVRPLRGTLCCAAQPLSGRLSHGSRAGPLLAALGRRLSPRGPGNARGPRAPRLLSRGAPFSCVHASQTKPTSP